MIKSIFISKCKELHIRIPFKMIIDIYNDDDEIPDELIQILFKPSEPMQYTMCMSEEGHIAFEKAVKEHLKWD